MKGGIRMIKVGIIGSTGYAGQELVRILLQHNEVEILMLGSRSYKDKKYYETYRNMFKLVDNVCSDGSIEELAKDVDVLFTATPNGYCSSIINEKILSRTKVIDLSADFRIKNRDNYNEWYGLEHNSFSYVKEAVYGLPEINRDGIKAARLIANPGCYPTCSILTVAPLLKENILNKDSLIIDAKSGTSGAGRGAKVDSLYCEVNENIKAYGVGTHRHIPEIEQELSLVAGSSLQINFTPHLVPMNRGILVTAYGSLEKSVTEEEVRDIYENYYKNENFVRILPKGIFPETRWVEGSNYVDINIKIDPRTNKVIMIGAIDNLVKGAAGQAVQNMNIMFGLEENAGLNLVPIFP